MNQRISIPMCSCAILLRNIWKTNRSSSCSFLPRVANGDRRFCSFPVSRRAIEQWHHYLERSTKTRIQRTCDALERGKLRLPQLTSFEQQQTVSHHHSSMFFIGMFSARRQMIPSSSLAVTIAIPDVPSHQRRLETSYTVQLGQFELDAYSILTWSRFRCTVESDV